MTIEQLIVEGKSDAEIATISAEPVHVPKQLPAGTAEIFALLVKGGVCTEEEAREKVSTPTLPFGEVLDKTTIAAIRERLENAKLIEQRRAEISDDDTEVTNAWNEWSHNRDVWIEYGGERPAKPLVSK